MNTLIGFGFILIAAVAGGVFGLQYRIMRKYGVDNASFLSMFFATIVVPVIACNYFLPGWMEVIREVGFGRNLLVFVFGFGWGLGAITYAYGFNILGMALAASLLKGLSVAIGSGVPLIRHWGDVTADGGPAISSEAKLMTIIGIFILLVGTAIAGKAGVMREKELDEEQGSPADTKGLQVKIGKGRLFWIGLLICFISGILSASANLGYEFADVLEAAMGTELTWRATLIRWMPMYWGGMTALFIFMGGSMVIRGSWRNYSAPGTLRDFLVSSSMGIVHFLAQIPYGIGAYYLGKLGTTVGWGVNLGMALVVAVSIGFMTGEWKGISSKPVRTILASVVVLLLAFIILGYANSLT
jgi:L-rhamnose-H+ transport protein